MLVEGHHLMFSVRPMRATSSAAEVSETRAVGLTEFVFFLGKRECNAKIRDPKADSPNLQTGWVD